MDRTHEASAAPTVIERRISSVSTPSAIGRTTSGQYDDVVKLADIALDVQPMHEIPAGEIDHHDSAARLGVTFAVVSLERQPGECEIAPRLGEAGDGEAAVEGKPAQIAGAEGKPLEVARSRIDGAEDSRCRTPAPTACRDRRAASAASTAGW